eukprot:8397128-Pyramimonas_sp.AAC.1
MVIAGAFIDLPNEKLVTYRNLGTKPTCIITPDRFAQIDRVLRRDYCVPLVSTCQACLGAALNSHHYLLLVDLAIAFSVKADARDPRT